MANNEIILEPTKPQKRVAVNCLYSTYAYFYSPTFSFRGESHDAWEIIFLNNGEVTIETDTYEQVLRKGQLFIHKPYEFHKIRANNVSCNTCFISFLAEGDELYSIAGRPFDTTPYTRQLVWRILDEGMLYLAGKNYIPPRLENETVEFAAGQIIQNMIELLLVELIRDARRGKAAEPVKDLSGSEKTLVQCAKSYMMENVYRKLTLEEIANNLGYSVSHVSSVFRKSTGLSVINYFIQLRIGKAKELIAEGKHSLKEISEMLDFDSTQYFSSQFKKCTNVTPSQYAATIKLKKWENAGGGEMRIR